MKTLVIYLLFKCVKIFLISFFFFCLLNYFIYFSLISITIPPLSNKDKQLPFDSTYIYPCNHKNHINTKPYYSSTFTPKGTPSAKTNLSKTSSKDITTVGESYETPVVATFVIQSLILLNLSYVYPKG